MLKEGHTTHKEDMNKLNLEYDHKLKIAYEQRDKLVDEYERTKTEYKGRLEKILDSNKQSLQHIEEDYRKNYEELQKNHIRLINDKK